MAARLSGNFDGVMTTLRREANHRLHTAEPEPAKRSRDTHEMRSSLVTLAVSPLWASPNVHMNTNSASSESKPTKWCSYDHQRRSFTWLR
jgi:hypothetical protein